MMIRIYDLNEVQNANKQIREFRKGFHTNLFTVPEKLLKWIKQGCLFQIQFEETLFVLRKNGSFYNVYYTSSTVDSLSMCLKRLSETHNDEILVFDIIGDDDKTGEIRNSFHRNGFHLYTSLVRMNRLTIDYPSTTSCPNLSFPTDLDLFEIQHLFQAYFDIYAEQIPYIEDLKKWKQENGIIIYSAGKSVAGFIIFEIIGISSYLRYWFVHPDYREKGIGSKLMSEFFRRSNQTKKQYFWVIESNDNALKRYFHYGFALEHLKDYIYINSDIKYER